MKVAKVQSDNSSFVVGYYGEWKPQSIYVPVCLCSLVPSKSSSIWTNLKNKANPNDRTQNTGYTIQKKKLKTNPM